MTLGGKLPHQLQLGVQLVEVVVMAADEHGSIGRYARCRRHSIPGLEGVQYFARLHADGDYLALVCADVD